MKKFLIIILALAAAAGAVIALGGSRGHEAVNYRLVTVEQGDLEATVSATGTLDAVTTVQVGTQVSGIIEEICVDYNDAVAEGQVIARIDRTLLSNAVAGADAQLARTQAELLKAQLEYDRAASLREENLVSESEYDQTRYSLDSAKASVRSAEVDLTRARQNLDYATITSPIGGTVVSRSVDVGQTVQASFSAPELFLIAGDLTAMQILVSVDESDIGLIAEGQAARFTVQAYADDEFEGVVRQVRLQSASQENVVSYTAVIDVANPDGRLLPGMTATVDFLVETASDVTYVANASLRYKPDDATMQAAFEKLRAERQATGGGEGRGAGPGAMAGRGGVSATDRGLLWTVDENGDLRPVPVRTGISDGVNTQVLGRDLEAGLQVVAGVSRGETSESSSGNPFQQQKETRRAGPPPPGGF